MDNLSILTIAEIQELKQENETLKSLRNNDTKCENKILDVFSYLFHEGNYLEVEDETFIISGERDHNDVMTIRIKLLKE